MSEAEKKPRSAVWPFAWLALAYVVSFAARRFDVGDRLFHLIVSHAWDNSWQTWQAIQRLFTMGETVVNAGYTMTLIAATIGVPLSLLARSFARARARAGAADPLDALRRFELKYPRVTKAIVAAPAVIWAALLGSWVTQSSAMLSSWDSALPAVVLPMTVVFAAQIALLRRAWAGLVAPTLEESELSIEAAKADGFTFNAVAVTPETVGAVGVLAALSVVMAALAFVFPTPTLMHSPVFFSAIVGYIGLAAGSAALFRRTSRISVGLDGISIGGNTRARFISFQEIDGARARGINLDLLRGDKVVLRLQLHGEDTIRRDALAERIRAAIALAVTHRDEPAVDFVRSATADALDRAASGAASYREAAPTREKLWDALESPAVDPAGRKAAAAALARDGSSAERARLRIAAEQCAEPSVRARIKELVDDLEEPAEEPTARKALVAR